MHPITIAGTKVINLTGRVFSRLTVMSYVPLSRWLCRCECGREKVIEGSKLKRGITRSCGCLRAEAYRGVIKHGGSNTPEYTSWMAMRDRCKNPNASGYADYGGRGILVCDRWDDFAAFRADMGPRPKGHSIERDRVHGNYEPGNCRWASVHEQARNTRRTRKFTIGISTHCLKDWADAFEINYFTIRSRLKRGLSISAALGGVVACQDLQ